MESILNLYGLSGKQAVITGGGSGLGFGIAQAFVEAGGKVVLVGRNEDRLARAAEQLGSAATYRVFDIVHLAGIPAFVQALETEVGAVDILVNNAGKHLKADALTTTDDAYLEVLQTNLLSVFALTREFGASMIRRGSGSILLISSMTAAVAMEKVVGYSTSKTALLGMMRTLSVEWARHNVRINAIAPGWIASDMLDAALANDEPRKQKILARIPYGRFGQPADIGRAAVFLSSNAATYISNVLLPVDGGAFQAL